MINTINIDKIKSLISKYGIFKSIDIIVGGKETIKQIYINNPSEFLNQFNDLKPVEIDDKIFYVDKNGLSLFMYHSNKKNGYLYLNYDRIWFFFSDVIGIETTDIQYIINNWLNDRYNLNGLTPDKHKFGGFLLLQEIYNI